MLIESLIKETDVLQEFRVVEVARGVSRLVVVIAPDRRFSPRCGQCLELALYRDTRPTRMFRCAWGTVATAAEEAVAYELAHCDLEGLTHIGIDEISRKHGHVCITNVYDLGSKRPVWSGEGRFKGTLEAFFDFPGPEKSAALQGIAVICSSLASTRSRNGHARQC